MAKDSKQTDIKVGDRVTITGTVVDIGNGDCVPCQVRIDGPESYGQPLVSLESPLLTVTGSSAPNASPAAPAAPASQPAAPQIAADANPSEAKSAETQPAATAATTPPPPEKPAAPAAPAAKTTK